METGSYSIAHQHYYLYQCSWPEEEVCPGVIRSCDVGGSYLSAKTSLGESTLVSSSSPADIDGSCFGLLDQDPVEVKNEDWMEWLAKDLRDREVGPSHCESSESSEMAGSASSSEDLTQPRPPELVNVLFRCAKLEEHDKAPKDPAELQTLGDSTQRLVSYFARGLCGGVEMMDAAEMAAAYTALNDACPYFNFANLTANQAILESMENTDKIHIIDFGIRQGVQWAGLLQALASRPQGKPRMIKISGLPTSSEAASGLFATATRLTEFASMLGLELQFNPVFKPLDKLVDEQADEADLSVFKIENEESVAVNFMLSLSQLTETGVSRVLRLARSLRPKIITLAEYELSCGFDDVFLYFSAIFDSLGCKFSSDCAERVKAEKLLFVENITTAVAGLSGKYCLRPMEKWRSTMEFGGFECCTASQYALSQAKILLWDYSDRFSVVECAGSVSLAWQDRRLVTVSSWTC